MAWNYNQYYKLSLAGTTAIGLGESLLQSYPLTKSCLIVLGHRLVDTVEFGYFQAGHDTIVEGEQGKDLYLLCVGKVDVLVGGKKVVTMDGPSLLGDKGIVQSNSTRSATIRVADKQICLFLKIPMDLFLKDFKANVPDAHFAQESAIYASMFQTIQDRLFHYMTHQKNLWEEANTTLNQLNIRLLSKGIETQKPSQWDPDTWAQVKALLSKLFGYQWPESFKANTSNLYNVLAKFLGAKMLPLKARLKTAEYELARQRLWQGWLDDIARVVAKHLPKESLPLNIGEVELFNPKLFRVKLLTLLRNFEKRLPLAEGEQHKAENFFGKAEKINFLELFPYLEHFGQSFTTPRPQWVKALLAQRTAQVAATSENNFNSSIVRMQSFIDRVKGMALDLGSEATVEEVDFKVIDEKVRALLPSYDAYLRTSEVPVGGHIGEICFHPDEVPKIAELIKISGSKTIRLQIEHAFDFITAALGLSVSGLPKAAWQSYFRVYRAGTAERLVSRELQANYWIPISSGLQLWQGKVELTKLLPGSLLGGHSWAAPSSEQDPLEVNVPGKVGGKKVTACLFCIPKASLPWNQEKWNPQWITNKYAPLLQWFSTRYLQTLTRLMIDRDESFDTWSKAELFRDLEARVQRFENKGVQIVGKLRERILTYLSLELGFAEEQVETNNSINLSKQVYNHILRQIKTKNPDLGVDEVGNQAYTQFRFHLTEMVEIYKDFDPIRNPLTSPVEILPLLENQVRRIFLHLGQAVEEDYFEFTDASQPKLRVDLIAEKMALHPDSFRKFCNQLMVLLEQVQLDLILETASLKTQLSQIHSIRSSYDVAGMQTKLVAAGVSRLQSFLKRGINQTAGAQPQ